MLSIANMPNQIDIGFIGETKFRKIEINMAKWLEEMPDGVPSIVHIRPGETAADAYIAATTFENGILTWTISAGDLGTVEGVGTAQIWLEEEENDSIVKRGKSILVATMIHGAINDASEVVPAAQEAWMEQMTALKTQTVKAAEVALHGPYVDEDTGNWMIWDEDDEEYIDTGIHAQGPIGVKSLAFTLDTVTNVSGSYEHATLNDAVTATMKPIVIEVSNPNIFLDFITVTCENGSITLSCPSVEGTSTVIVVVEEIAQSPYEPYVTSEEFAVLNGRIGLLANLVTENKSNIVSAINELAGRHQIPSGGSAGDLLCKSTNADYAVTWVTPATSAEADNTRPITAAAVYAEIGNVNSLLATI